MSRLFFAFLLLMLIGLTSSNRSFSSEGSNVTAQQCTHPSHDQTCRGGRRGYGVSLAGSGRVRREAIQRRS